MINQSAIKTTKLIFICLPVFLVLSSLKAKGQPNVIEISRQIFSVPVGKKIDLFIDSFNNYNNKNIITCNKFSLNTSSVPNYQAMKYKMWIRITLKNIETDSNFFLNVNYSNISSIHLYRYDDTTKKLILLSYSGNALPFYNRMIDNIDFAFPIKISHLEYKTYYLEILTRHPLEIPITITNSVQQSRNSIFQNFIIGIYLGIIISIFFYNFFLFISTRDKNYFIYVIYLFLLAFAQVTYAGWCFKYLWPNDPGINLYATVITSAIAGIAGLIFGKIFLNAAQFTPKLNKVISVLVFVYIIALISTAFKQISVGYLILNISSLTGGIILLITSLIISKQGYKPALFYFLAWSFFLLAIIVFVLRNVGLIATNNFTHSIVYFGTAIQTILLSIALADRINTLKKEKELSQADALQRAEENEMLVREQNIVLESKVENRTREIKEANTQLSVALDTLKDAQAQLVDAEKMASLGQLTAGIAHEINNPINFVKSNINPLRLDVKDLVDVLNEYADLHNINDETSYKKKLQQIEKFKDDVDVDFIKTEINSLIVGIEEGAERTAEIVRGLKTFSRVDEAELKTADIHDGISSTLVLLKNSMPYFIKLEKNFEAEGIIECYPGKLNQVFMNIINNAIQAIKEKTSHENECIEIKTKDIPGNLIQISIRDTGIGMTEEVKHKIFEPFFTTKEVGEGTGLGMAIVFKIIQKHNGKIDIMSKKFYGSEFIITLPHKHPISDHY